MILEGSLSVKAALLAGRREIACVMIDRTKHDKDTAFIIRTAEKYGIPIRRMERTEIDALAEGRTHGGVLAEAGNRVYQEVGELPDKENLFVVLAEGVEDPFNLGYIMRTLYSAGCDGLLLKKRDWSFAEKTILRASAGASEYINTVLCDDPVQTVETLKQTGMHVYAAMRKDAVVYTEPDYTGRVMIMLGGEMRGLSSSLLALADQNIYIPYANDFRNALNAAGAAAVLSFEVLRQRTETGGH